jgi:hypothetical protein
MYRWKAVVLLTEDVNTDLQRAEARIVERRDVQVAIAPRDEDISGAIVGARRVSFVDACRHAHHNVADTTVQCFLKEGLALRKPEIGDLHVEIFADECGELIFKSLLLVIGVGEIVGIRTDA